MTSFPILDYDPSPNAIVNPHPPKLTEDAPPCAVLCFFQDVLDGLVKEGRLHRVGACISEMGKHPLYIMEHESRRLLVFHPGVGASLVAAFLDEIIPLGVHNFIVCGGCGALNPLIDVEHPIIITTAVRDEGTSYHYLPPSREVAASSRAVAALEQVFKSHALSYRLGKTWTTDGLYRETTDRRSQRVAEGCEVVEMEAAAFFAVAQFRGVQLGQVVYGGDLVVPDGWDKRNWHDRINIRQSLFWLAVEACLMLNE